jgi:hypothetical protein
MDEFSKEKEIGIETLWSLYHKKGQIELTIWKNESSSEYIWKEDKKDILQEKLIAELKINEFESLLSK